MTAIGTTSTGNSFYQAVALLYPTGESFHRPVDLLYLTGSNSAPDGCFIYFFTNFCTAALTLSAT